MVLVGRTGKIEAMIWNLEVRREEERAISSLAKPKYDSVLKTGLQTVLEVFIMSTDFSVLETVTWF